MAVLQDVIDQLKENNNDQKNTNKLLNDWITSQKRSAGDRLEAAIKSKITKPVSGNQNVFKQVSDDTSSLGLPLLTPIALAFGAWVTDLDAYLRSIRPDVLLKPVITFFDTTVAAFTRLTKFVTDLSEIRLPDVSIKIPSIRYLDAAGEAIGDFIDYKVRLPVINFVDGAGKALGDFIDYKIKLPALTFVDDAGKAITEFIPESVKGFFNKITALFDDITDYGKKLSLTVPETFKSFFTKVSGLFTDIGDWFKGIEATFDIKPLLDPIKNALGFTAEGDTPGKGLLGLFSSIDNFLKPVLKPIATVTRILAGPFVQGFLSLLDFVKGFSDAFGETIDEETGEVKTFSQRVLAGFEGGVLGVIKGITDAIELLFLDFPAWILGKLGFENVSTFLKDLPITDMVDPVWNWIKSIPGMIMDLIPSAEELKTMTINMIAKIPGGYYLLKAMGATGPALELARTNAALEEAQASILENQDDINRSLAGEDVYSFLGGTERMGRERSARRIRDLQEEIRELEEQRNAQSSLLFAPQTTNNSGGNTNQAFNFDESGALDIAEQRRMMTYFSN